MLLSAFFVFSMLIVILLYHPLFVSITQWVHWCVMFNIHIYRGHKLYAVLRRSEFIENVRASINNDMNYERYKVKITNYVTNKNIDMLSKHIILRPNVILSMMNSNSIDNIRTMLYFVIYSKSSKSFNLYLASLFHFCQKYLKNQKFAQTYLSYKFVK